MKSGSLNLLEPPGPAQACNGIASPLPFTFSTRSLAEGASLILHHRECGTNFFPESWNISTELQGLEFPYNSRPNIRRYSRDDSNLAFFTSSLSCMSPTGQFKTTKYLFSTVRDEICGRTDGLCDVGLLHNVFC